MEARCFNIGHPRNNQPGKRLNARDSGFRRAAFGRLSVVVQAALNASKHVSSGVKLSQSWGRACPAGLREPYGDSTTAFRWTLLAGAIVGAAIAVLFLLAINSDHALEGVIVILGAIAASIRFVNYALYCAAIAAAALIAIDLPHPSNLGNEWRCVLYTLIGVGIAVVIMLLANLLQKRLAPATPRPTNAGSTRDDADQVGPFHIQPLA